MSDTDKIALAMVEMRRCLDLGRQLVEQDGLENKAGWDTFFAWAIEDPSEDAILAAARGLPKVRALVEAAKKVSANEEYLYADLDAALADLEGNTE